LYIDIKKNTYYTLIEFQNSKLRYYENIIRSNVFSFMHKR